jgi:class 3 adenylate cyclase
MLPQFVKDRVKDGARYIAEDQGFVTIVFIDIVDFDSIFAMYDPPDFIKFLDELFQKFDEICEANGCVKIETVGKTYLVCAGLKDSDLNLSPELSSMSHAQRALEMATDVIRNCQHIRVKNGDPLQVKIGVNTGPVTAGVVGHHKPQFSLVGDTVNTASRMGSTLIFPNMI